MTTITRYEILARHKDGRSFLIGYTPRLSRSGLLAAMQKQGDAIVAKLKISESETLTFGTKPRPFALTGDWRIAFTGRTQLDAKREGEMPFVAA